MLRDVQNELRQSQMLTDTVHSPDSPMLSVAPCKDAGQGALAAQGAAPLSQLTAKHTECHFHFFASLSTTPPPFLEKQTPSLDFFQLVKIGTNVGLS